MRVPTSCRSMTSTSTSAQHLGRRLARLAVQRVDGHAAACRRSRAASRSCFPAHRSGTRAAGRRSPRAGCRGAPATAVGDVPEVGGRPRPDCRRGRSRWPLRRDGHVTVEQAFEAKPDRHARDYWSPTCVRPKPQVDRLRALGGVPRLLRPRREPIEPQVLTRSLLTTCSRRRSGTCTCRRLSAGEECDGSKALRRKSSVHDRRGGTAGTVQPRPARSNRCA